MSSRQSNHPIGYKIFHPNALVEADKTELRGAEMSVYNEVINHNHKKTPEQLIYNVPYDTIFSAASKFNRNSERDQSILSKAIGSRVIYLNKKYVAEYLGERAPRSFNPIADLIYKDEHIEVHLHKVFKRVLCNLEAGFTKGDIETLRTFNHDITHHFYWLARQKQTFKKVWRIALDDFRKALHIKGYADFRDLKKRILDPILEDMKGTWMEFELELVKKGRGGKVSELIFKFKNGPKEEADLPAGKAFNWEKQLLNLGISEHMTKQIRQLVKAAGDIEDEYGNKTTWDSHYVQFSIQAAAEQYKKQEKGKTKIRDKAAWFIDGILTGRWVQTVIEKRQELYNQSQKNLFE